MERMLSAVARRGPAECLWGALGEVGAVFFAAAGNMALVFCVEFQAGALVSSAVEAAVEAEEAEEEEEMGGGGSTGAAAGTDALLLGAPPPPPLASLELRDEVEVVEVEGDTVVVAPAPVSAPALGVGGRDEVGGP